MATSPEPLKDLLEESFKLFRVKSPDPDLYTKLMVPSSLAVIDAGVFSHSRVRFVYIPESVVAIEKSAFSYTRLESVLIPKSVMLIGDKAFSNCSRLKKGEFASFNAPEKFGKSACH